MHCFFLSHEPLMNYLNKSDKVCFTKHGPVVQLEHLRRRILEICTIKGRNGKRSDNGVLCGKLTPLHENSGNCSAAREAFLFYWKGLRPFATPKGSTPQKSTERIERDNGVLCLGHGLGSTK